MSQLRQPSCTLAPGLPQDGQVARAARAAVAIAGRLNDYTRSGRCGVAITHGTAVAGREGPLWGAARVPCFAALSDRRAAELDAERARLTSD